MSGKTLGPSRPDVDNSRRTFGRWPMVLLGASLLWAGCGRSTEPATHEVHKPISPEPATHEVDKPISPEPATHEVDKPISPDPPSQIIYPDIPKVPERIERPSPPIEEDSASSK